jgi:hydroxyquinol 1,2-dioxygenase
MAISPYRPAHVHFDVSADGFASVITHIFRNGDKYLDTDVVFAVKDRLIVDFVEQKPGTAANGEQMTTPYLTATFDFVLAPARVPAMSA